MYVGNLLVHIESWGSGGAYHPVVRLVGLGTVGLAVTKVGTLGRWVLGV